MEKILSEKTKRFFRPGGFSKLKKNVVFHRGPEKNVVIAYVVGGRRRAISPGGENLRL